MTGPGPGYPTRPGYVPEEFLGQIRTGPDAPWEDYARGTEEGSRRWQAEDPDNRRVVDWIDKDRVIFPPPPTVPETGGTDIGHVEAVASCSACIANGLTGCAKVWMDGYRTGFYGRTPPSQVTNPHGGTT